MTVSKHTQFAMKALDMADMFKAMVGAKPLQGPVIYLVELGTPDGPSTGGGKQASQAIKLIPQGAGTTLVAGHANKAGKTAELRSYDFLAQQHAERFKGVELPVQRQAYEELLARLSNFFASQDLSVSMVRPPPDAVIPQSETPTAIIHRPGTQSGGIPWLAIAGAIALAASGFFILGR